MNSVVACLTLLSRRSQASNRWRESWSFRLGSASKGRAAWLLEFPVYHQKFFAYGAAASIRMALRKNGPGIYVRLSISDEGEIE